MVAFSGNSLSSKLFIHLKICQLNVQQLKSRDKPEAELKILDVVANNMIVKFDINSFEQFLKLPYFNLDAGLSKGVVILDPVQNFSHAPEAVRLYILPNGLVQTFELQTVPCHVLVNKILEEYHQEGGDEVVDALDVARGRVPDGPDVEDPLHHLLHTSLLEQSHQRGHARDVYSDLSTT